MLTNGCKQARLAWSFSELGTAEPQLVISILKKQGNCWKQPQFGKSLALAIVSHPYQFSKSDIGNIPHLKHFLEPLLPSEVNRTTQNMPHTLLVEFSINKATAEKQPLFEKY